MIRDSEQSRVTVPVARFEIRLNFRTRESNSRLCRRFFGYFHGRGSYGVPKFMRVQRRVKVIAYTRAVQVHYECNASRTSRYVI